MIFEVLPRYPADAQLLLAQSSIPDAMSHVDSKVQQKGREIFHSEGPFKRNVPGGIYYTVRNYCITVHDNQADHCTCQFFAHYNGVCKHMYAVYLQLKGTKKREKCQGGRVGAYSNRSLDKNSAKRSFGPYSSLKRPARKSVWDSGVQRKGRKSATLRAIEDEEDAVSDDYGDADYTE